MNCTPQAAQSNKQTCASTIHDISPSESEGALNRKRNEVSVFERLRIRESMDSWVVCRGHGSVPGPKEMRVADSGRPGSQVISAEPNAEIPAVVHAETGIQY